MDKRTQAQPGKILMGACRWEEERSIDREVSRLKVPGGWVVTTVVLISGGGDCNVSATSVFVADRNHGWVLSSNTPELEVVVEAWPD
jgi:hypothetical protein